MAVDHLLARLTGDLIERLDQLAATDPDHTLIIELIDDSDEAVPLSAACLRARATAVSIALENDGLRPGDVALLIATSPVEWMVGFIGCLRAGIIAAPIAFPRRPEHLTSRLEPVRLNAGAKAIVAGPAQGPGERKVLELLSAGERSVVPTVLPPIDDPLPPPVPKSLRDVAYLQFTSGSTSEPKGVIVTYANLTANLDSIAKMIGLDVDSVVVSWNPLTHDMGLVMGALPSIGFGLLCVLMSPAAFSRHPIAWLRAVERYRGTHGYSPNFGYDLLVDRTTQEERSAFDLTCMQAWFNGAEPVRVGTRDRFLEAFAVSGATPSAWRPGYGLAEATVLVSATPSGDPGAVLWLEASALEAHRVVIVADGSVGARSVCSVGVPGPGFDVAVVDEKTLERAAPNRIGELWVRGPSVSPGYWNRPEETTETFGSTLPDDDGGPWLRTGDLAFLHDGEIFVCGRLKDLIVINGRNLHPQDIELVADLAHEGVRHGGTAAFSVDADDREAVALLVEVDDLTDETLCAEVRGAVRAAVLREFEVRVKGVHLVGPRGVPKTSSGKIQRTTSREIYQQATARSDK